MAQKIEIRDFRFAFTGHGHYYTVTYTSPVTGKQWTVTTNDLTLLDATRYTEKPLKKDLEILKRKCKRQ